MMLSKILLLGTAAGLATIAGAAAADLPTRKAAPVEYVRICDAYGKGFFYIPGTDTCLHVGGLVLAETEWTNTPYRVNMATGAAAPVTLNALGGLSYAGVPIATTGAAYVNSTGRDQLAYATLGRVELDARNQTAYGTLRTFIRVESQFGIGPPGMTGSLGSGPLAATVNGAGTGAQAARETTILNKGFIQFAGITAGRVQSFFDFYADAVGYTAMRGSNNTVSAFAYTLTGGNGWSGTLSVEDQVSHRGPVGSVVNLVGLPTGFGAPVGAFGSAGSAVLNGTRIPDIIAVIRTDQPWGSAQLSGATHQVRAGLDTIANFASPQDQVLTVSKMGFAVEAGVKFNLSQLAPGDVLWLQAVYSKGGIGYTSGSNLAFTSGVNTSTAYGAGLARIGSGNNWNAQDMDCVFSWSGSCDLVSTYAITGAFKHYFTPTVSGSLTANYYSVRYSNAATNPLPGMLAAGGQLTASAATTNGAQAITNYKEYTMTAGLQWSPIPNFEIGAEGVWQHGITSRPVGLAPDPILALAGLPRFHSNGDLYRGRLRIVRAF